MANWLLNISINIYFLPQLYTFLHKLILQIFFFINFLKVLRLLKIILEYL